MAIEISPLEIINLQMLQSSFEMLSLDDETAERPEDITFGFECSDVQVQEEGALLIGKLTVDMAPGEDQENVEFQLTMTARGIINVDDDAPMFDPDFVDQAKVQVFQALLAFIRAQVQSITSQSPVGQVNLPLMELDSVEEDL
ncbi:MAG: hypothetical protein PUA57_02575 [Eggerthellales bacterium]|nr:hypothetical protein [Eggerthellales bacterium]